MKHLHLSLSEELYAALMREAEASGQAVTALVQEAIEKLLAEQERRALNTALDAYIRAENGGSHDLDEELEAGALTSQQQQLRLAYEQYTREYEQDEPTQEW
ncbi:hypothetical protein DAETH_12220 [Deinococcus aetherius]|uniref:Ribbon-helix-helix protein CopG domain-containing protein n=1 Tax=Deinococcus aetherius TaxID=200252 RepID=A0ABN6RF02_9DEIO|nr:hypothetical protein [Deinococcus aetherius]BDP41253.1 hypothetical protein DAETH_12220 [Deinococcus aetherius]